MIRLLRLSVVLGLALALPAAGQAPPGGGPRAPAQVGVVTLARSEVPVSVLLPGRAVAYSHTAIRPLVGGTVSEIAFEPGREVKAGTLLFRLRDETLAAQISAETMAVTSAEAALKGATATVERLRKLQGTGASRVDVEAAEVALAGAQAALGAAQARRDLAALALARTEIASPIDGIVDVATVSLGDLVSAGQSQALTTVTQLDPIYVDVAESRARILRNRERMEAGTLTRTDALEAEVILETGESAGGGGTLVSPGTAVSPTTGTVPLRLQFANPERRLLPGQFVRVRLTVGRVDAILVPQRASRRAASGALTVFVARGGKAAEVRLTEVGTHDSAWIVTEGVEAGDLLVLDGLTNLRDGAPVEPVPVTIDAEGVVRSSVAATEPAAGNAGTAAPASARPPVPVSAPAR